MMNKKWAIFVSIALVVIIVVCIVLFTNDSTENELESELIQDDLIMYQKLAGI